MNITIEEKAKAYDEAIAHAKLLLKTIGNATLGNLVFKNEFENMFPELAESGDERIRKALKEYFINSFQNNGVAAICGVHIKDILTWLEKQVEQKPTDIQSIEKRAHEVFPDDDDDENTPLYRQAFIDGAVDYIDCGCKNTDWSEEDERLCQCIIEDQEEALDKVRNSKYGHSEIISDLKEMYHERINFLKSLKDRVQPQPKQEWSEEDERILYNITQYISYVKENKCVTKSCYIEAQNWLKSLKERYIWKPSEEQMDALEHAINCYSGISPTNIEEVYTLEIMKEQLKKLREE